ncbi:helix-turn-helix domain-containing protein [Latilactobacillus curvatus]|uniref:helix-turn-helix domain-containing protein n=1 Tax=Lactobacillales TaxID=186826 RepID=UPI000975C419|nr:helix-turn-helix domain-containing protein [Latilactobacillus curvatus]MCT1215931.1 helix-turn-helix domain-containing protein [Latilactobacillus curvatus]MCT3533083.1 helix-turn-helix domain-containing protein [Latilactobacillus curvatus]
MHNFDNATFIISPELIIAASSGDPLAITKMVQHYQGYIVSLSLRNSYENGMKSSVYVDEFIRRSLESKLIEKITTFDINR